MLRKIDIPFGLLGDEGREYVLHLVGERDDSDLALGLTEGRWNIAIYDPHENAWIGPGGEAGAAHQVHADGPTRLTTPAHPHSLLLHLRRESQ